MRYRQENRSRLDILQQKRRRQCAVECYKVKTTKILFGFTTCATAIRNNYTNKTLICKTSVNYLRYEDISLTISKSFKTILFTKTRQIKLKRNPYQLENYQKGTAIIQYFDCSSDLSCNSSIPCFFLRWYKQQMPDSLTRNLANFQPSLKRLKAS